MNEQLYKLNEDFGDGTIIDRNIKKSLGAKVFSLGGVKHQAFYKNIFIDGVKHYYNGFGVVPGEGDGSYNIFTSDEIESLIKVEPDTQENRYVYVVVAFNEVGKVKLLHRTENNLFVLDEYTNTELLLPVISETTFENYALGKLQIAVEEGVEDLEEFLNTHGIQLKPKEHS